MPYQVTHFTRGSSNPDGWIQLGFISIKANDQDTFYIGLQPEFPLTRSEIEVREQAGSIERLPQPEPIGGSELLWLSGDNKIWVASKNDPINDPHRRLVGHVR